MQTSHYDKQRKEMLFTDETNINMNSKIMKI